MTKLQEIKAAIARTPPDRLAKIEYQSHFFQIIGITIVCVILILRDLWWVIFAFIFGLGVSYSHGMTAYIKYYNIKALLQDENPKDYKNDISPTRKRSKIINYSYGAWPNRISGVVAVWGSYLWLGLDYTVHSRLVLSLVYPISIAAIYIFTYFILFYWIANLKYEKEMKDED